MKLSKGKRKREQANNAEDEDELYQVETDATSVIDNRAESTFNNNILLIINF